MPTSAWPPALVKYPLPERRLLLAEPDKSVRRFRLRPREIRKSKHRKLQELAHRPFKRAG